MSRRALRIALCLALASGCGMVHTETRVERGPVVSREVRESVPKQAQLTGHVEARWPHVAFHVVKADVCRAETVEASVEDTITERSVPGSGPALAMGISQVGLGLGLLAVQGLFSDQPNTREIDPGGHFGAPPRQVAVTVGVVLAAVGLPALAVGAAGSVLSGESTESRRVETVVNANEAACHEISARGALAVDGASGVAPLPLSEGTAVLDAEQLRKLPSLGFTVDGAPVHLADDELETLAEVRGCLAVTPLPTGPQLAALDLPALQAQLDQARVCTKVPAGPGAAAVSALEGELLSRPSPEQTRAQHLRLPTIGTYEDALKSYPPKLQVAPDTREAERLSDAESLAGDAIELTGVWGRALDPGTWVVNVGSLAVVVLVDDAPAWVKSLSPGDRVELVAVVLGREKVKDLEGPVVRAVWGRPRL